MEPVMPAPMAAQSAVLVPVPEAEPAVSRHRARLDRAAAWGVPAHVTILYPFAPPLAITAATTAALAAAAAPVRAFDCRFPATGWFGQDVLWLAPRPAGRFRAVTRAVPAAFPGCLPYGGAYQDAVPHLTVGDRPAGSRGPAGSRDRTAARPAHHRAHQPGVADDRHDRSGQLAHHGRTAANDLQWRGLLRRAR